MDFIFLWLVTFVLGFWINKKLRQWKNLPPGPWGFPIVGYLPFFDRNSPHLTLTKLAREYGPIYSIKMGSIPAVVLSDHKLIREAFAKEEFSGRAPLYLTHGIMKGNGIICAEGALWKDQRKLITTWLKSFGMSKHSPARDRLESRIASGVNELIQNVKEAIGKPIGLTEMVTNSLGNVINDIIFGYKYPHNDKTWIWFRQIQEEGCHEMGVAGVVNFLPFLRFFMPSIKVTMEVLTRGQAQTHKLYASIIEKRRKLIGIPQPEKAFYAAHDNMFNEHPQGHIKCITYSKHSSNSEHYFDPDVLHASKDECILDNFLKEQKRRYDASEESAKYMTDEQLVYLLADMFGAGLDTTSVTIAWYFLFMALYPEVQDHVRKEIMTVCPDESEIDHAKLPYLMATICETQRVRSIVPVGIPHGCVKDTYLGDYRIAKGTMVVPLQWAVHMDPSSWEEPEKFQPSRFLDEDGNLLKPQEFIAFQTGKRMCPGDELSRMISVGLIARFFKTFKLRLASDPPTEEEMMGKVGLTLSPPETKFFCDLI
ncbi:cytochrome P450 306a1 isoform X1 [Pieris napi]|uniref:cytochrome P450 306a1 isoform X1 n=2 Tax=Pieris napi TaxID=78633 RepID=UPI001FB8D8EC|nr:cytochrome P450 306a1 isoform X1 [Pieris napi]